MKASARATKASAVVGLTGNQSIFSEVITCTLISWTCSYPHQVFIWLSLNHRSGRLSPRLCVAHSLIRFRFQGIPKFLGRPPYTMFSTHLLFPRKLSHEVLRAQHQMRANMPTSSSSFPRRGKQARFPSCVNGLQLGVKGNSDLLSSCW